MKKLILWMSIGLINCLSLAAQESEALHFYFDSAEGSLGYEPAMPGNIWEIGTPNKQFFASAYTTPNAIATGLFGPHPEQVTCSFVLSLKPAFHQWAQGGLVFTHKYDTDAGLNGGFIDVKYDQDATWTPLLLDDPSGGIFALDCYALTDVITGGIPAFSGTSADWVTTNVFWNFQNGNTYDSHDSIMVRFTFKAGANPSNKEGWMIDNINFSLTGPIQNGLTESISYSGPKAFPNPFHDQICLSTSPGSENGPINLEVFDAQGRVRLARLTDPTQPILVHAKELQNPGIYFYKISSNNYSQTGIFQYLVK